MGKNKKQEDHTSKKGIQKYELNKIIYFDKETIKNILQEYNKGTKQTIVRPWALEARLKLKQISS